MHARLVAGIVILWACVAMAATASGTLSDPVRRPGATPDVVAPQGQGQKQNPTKPFKHSEHVNRAWQSLAIPEVFRDCRGCHRFSAEAPHSTPQAECDSCHQGAGKLQREFDAAWQNDLSAYSTRTSPAFRHYTHGMLECRQCHYDEVGLFAHMPIKTGPAFCAECHEKTVTAADVSKFQWLAGIQDAALAKAVGLQGPFTRPADNAAYARQLDSVFAGEAGGINTVALLSGGEFDHADHINTGVGAEQGLACTACHIGIEEAGVSGTGLGVIPTEGCKACHIRDADGSAAKAAPASEKVDRRPLWSLGTFVHADHFGFLQEGGKRKEQVSSDQAYSDIEGQQCAACHTYTPEVAGLSERDFPFDGESSKHTYSDCVQCHTVEGWQTGEQEGSTETPPLHSSSGGEGWRDCAACHELGEPDMAGLRPKQSVQRWTERTFLFEGQTHPHITTKGVARGEANGDSSLQKDCAVCHRAVVPELPTRLIEKAFTHKTHLPANPTAEHCAKCHSSAQNAANSLALSGDDYRTYSLDSCSTCHWGGDVTEQVDQKAKPLERDVVAFPHGLHVQAGQSCAECHESAADGRDMITKPAALACNQCHKHEAVDGQRPPERLLANEVASCVRCHHEDRGGMQVASVPPPKGSADATFGDRYLVEQTVFPGFADSQFHPAGSDCSTCHKRKDKRGKFAPIRVPTGKNHLMAAKGLGVHADVARGGFGKNAPADCLRCHWKPVGKWADAVGISAGEDAAKAFRAKPSSPSTREKFGNLFRGYPGREESDG